MQFLDLFSEKTEIMNANHLNILRYRQPNLQIQLLFDMEIFLTYYLIIGIIVSLCLYIFKYNKEYNEMKKRNEPVDDKMYCAGFSVIVFFYPIIILNYLINFIRMKNQ